MLNYARKTAKKNKKEQKKNKKTSKFSDDKIHKVKFLKVNTFAQIMLNQLDQDAKNELKKQHYRLIGEHSAVKICGWTKNMIKGFGSCYKFKFYGIKSNQCMQMTTSISCANRCIFCWRGYKAPVSKEWIGIINEPKNILKESLKAQKKLLEGFGGQIALKEIFEQSKKVKHVALSLTGEPITYPKINELIELFDKENISTFMVTNAQYPEEIKNLKRVTQLYLSIDAPTKELLKKIDAPLFNDYWERMNKSLEYCAQKKDRTCIRLTIIKELNDLLPEEYAKLILKGNPDFIEIKAYMHIGASRTRLNVNQMPWHEEIMEFTKKIMKYLPEYEIVTEHIPSRVVMCAKKEFKKNGKWYTWIDFEKWNKLINGEKDFSKYDFMKLTPLTDISHRNTQKEVEEKVKKKIIDRKNKVLNLNHSSNNETTEMELQ